MMNNTFVNAVINQEARTENGMKARLSTAEAVTDLFFKIGASRGKNIIPDFTAAYVENPDLAVRTALWARDVRSGAGERQLFRDILLYMEDRDPVALLKILPKVPELGRWDDLLLDWKLPSTMNFVLDMVKTALDVGNGLAAKWMPRKGVYASRLRNHFAWTPKFYRKRLVELTKVVESQMCAKDWDNINYSHVPSLAASRYKKAFWKHSPDKFKAYVDALTSGDKSVKVNAGAVYPYDVIKGIGSHYTNATELRHVAAQWAALPNYVGEANVLPLVDVSGSMNCKAGGDQSKSNLTCLDVAVSLGLYCADKNVGKFKDLFLTFSSSPELLKLSGNIVNKIYQMNSAKWQMSTNLHAALDLILDVAKKGNVPENEMPSTLLIMSDMQFNHCTTFDDSAFEMITRKYNAAGYKVPAIVFWNLNGRSNVPVSFNTSGVALVSGFSPSILKSVLSSKLEDMTPSAIARKTLMDSRYDW